MNIESSVKCLTYHQTSWAELCINGKAIQRRFPLDNGVQQCESTIPSSTSTVGQLDLLPVELWHATFLQLDLESLTMLRTVSRGAQRMVNGLPGYQYLLKHYGHVLCALLALGLGPWFTVQDLLDAVSHPDCTACGDLGVFFCFLARSRACYLCLRENPKFHPLTVERAKEEYGLNAKAISHIPVLCTIYSTDTPVSPLGGGRTRLVDPEVARQAGIAVHGSKQEMEKFVAARRASRMHHYGQQMNQPQRSTPLLTRPNIWGVFTNNDGEGDHTLRYMGVIYTPWFDRVGRQTETGLSCLACREDNTYFYSGPRHRHWVRLYTTGGYIGHIEECKKSQIKLTLLSNPI